MRRPAGAAFDGPPPHLLPLASRTTPMRWHSCLTRALIISPFVLCAAVLQRRRVHDVDGAQHRHPGD